MKKNTSTLLVIFTITALSIWKSNATLGVDSYATYGEALQFTSSQDRSFNTVTIYVNATELPAPAVLSLSLTTDTSADPTWPLAYDEPYRGIAQSYAPISSLGLLAYTFNMPATIQANVPYWFVVYLQVTSAEPYLGDWTADATVNSGITLGASDDLAFGSFIPSNPNESASFTLDTPQYPSAAVPEPTTWIAGAMMLILLVGSGIRYLLNRRYSAP